MWTQSSPPDWFSDARSGWHWYQRKNYGEREVRWTRWTHERTLSCVIYCENWMQLLSTLPTRCCSSNLKISDLETTCSVLGPLLPVLQSLPMITKNCNFLICLVQNENKPLQSNTSRSGLFTLCMNVVHKGMTKNELFTFLVFPVAGIINNTQIYMKYTSYSNQYVR